MRVRMDVIETGLSGNTCQSTSQRRRCGHRTWRSARPVWRVPRAFPHYALRPWAA